MTEIFKAVGFYLLGLIGVSILLLLWCLGQAFWSKAETNHPQFTPAAEFIDGTCRVVLFIFLLFASWYEMRYIYWHSQPIFWIVAVAGVVILNKWWTRAVKDGEH